MKIDILYTPFAQRSRILWVFVIAALAAMECRTGWSATLQEFGYQRMTVNGQLPRGSRALLVIIANFVGGNPLAHDVSYYDDFTFNLLRRPSVNSYFKEVSNERFVWSRGGVIGRRKFFSVNSASFKLKAGFGFAC